MTVLGIDTSFLSDTSIGYSFSGDEELEICLKAPLSQEEKLFYTIDSGFKILKHTIQDIDLFAVGIGPGSFTGLRIGLSAARTLAWSLKKKIIGLSSLELLALSYPDAGKDGNTLIVPVIDARMNRVFTAIFNGRARLSGDLDSEPEALRERILRCPQTKIILLGDGLKKYGAVISNLPGKDVLCYPDYSISGRTICRKALDVYQSAPEADYSPQTIEPVYLRKSEAETQRDKAIENGQLAL